MDMDEMVESSHNFTKKKGHEKQMKEVVAVDEELNESKMKKAYIRLVKENKRLKANERKAVKMLKETLAKLEGLATVNSQLALTTRLFTENSTTRAEKEQILAKMSKAKTVRESKIIFNMLTENLGKRTFTKNPQINKEQLSEAKQPKKLIKEETAYIDPEQERMWEIMFHRSKS